MPPRTPSCAPALWHVLTESSAPATELGRALSEVTPVLSWAPRVSSVGFLRRQTRRETSPESPNQGRIQFSLQRGYSRVPPWLRAVLLGPVSAMLQAQTPEPARTALVCTSSFWSTTAAAWPGPVIYYATDYTVAYQGLSAARVLEADRSMCSVADLVCANSARLADYLAAEARCPRQKLVVLPNATRAANLLAEPAWAPAALPAEIAHLQSRRPIAGVIGNMSANLDWELISAAMDAVPAFTWLFVGPASDRMRRGPSRAARARVLRSARAVVLGSRPYAELFRYARAVDVAVLPYARVEPTYSGSATRFYEHLAAGRPMLATRGVEELLHKEPLLTLVDGAAELAAGLRRLQDRPSDGLEEMRWRASQAETWEHRARSLQAALLERWTPPPGAAVAPTVEPAEAGLFQ